MQKITTPISGCYLLKPRLMQDERGCFVKPYQKEWFNELGLSLEITESFYSVSQQNVLRGLHFQLPPFAHHKLVSCIQGEIMDVVVDLRVGSPSFKQHALFHLKAHDSLYIPVGLAHGFYVLSEQATLLYNVTRSYQPESDCGIAWDSIGWRDAPQEPIVSSRDASFEALDAFESPFVFNEV